MYLWGTKCESNAGNSKSAHLDIKIASTVLPEAFIRLKCVQSEANEPQLIKYLPEFFSIHENTFIWLCAETREALLGLPESEKNPPDNE